jgi:hypothetical protein
MGQPPAVTACAGALFVALLQQSRHRHTENLGETLDRRDAGVPLNSSLQARQIGLGEVSPPGHLCLAECLTYPNPPHRLPDHPLMLYL